MELIIAILMYVNLLSPGDTPSNEMIIQNQSTIEHYSHDQVFMEKYTQAKSVGVFDIEAL